MQKNIYGDAGLHYGNDSRWWERQLLKSEHKHRKSEDGFHILNDQKKKSASLNSFSVTDTKWRMAVHE